MIDTENRKAALLRRHFKKSLNGEYSKIVLVIQMPDNSREIIINDQVSNKLDYINSAYDNDLKLKSNPKILIEDYMLVNK